MADNEHDTTACPTGPPSFTWTSHPLVERPGAAAAGIITIIAVAGAVYLCAESRWAAIGGVAVLSLALHRFFFVTRYVMDEEGIGMATIFGAKRLAWSEIRRCERGPRGAWLSPLVRRSWRDGRRGMLLLYGKQRKTIEQWLQRRVASPSDVTSTNNGPSVDD